MQEEKNIAAKSGKIPLKKSGKVGKLEISSGLAGGNPVINTTCKCNF